jgi:hypothetical protein
MPTVSYGPSNGTDNMSQNINISQPWYNEDVPSNTYQFRNEFPCNYAIFTHFPPLIAWNTSPRLPTSRIRKSSHVLTDETDDRAQNLLFRHMRTLINQHWKQHNWYNIYSFPTIDSLKHIPRTTYNMNP